ncbi:MAG: site-specific integrase [Mangrovibacterium sp.]
METMQTFGIQFITRQNKDQDSVKNHTIYARITVNGSRSEVSLKQNINPDDWNPVKGTAKGQRSEIKELNRFLEQVRTKLSNIYREMMVEGELPTATIIKNQFLGVEEEGNTLLDAFDYHKKISEGDISVNTLRHYNTTEKYVKEFLQKQHKTTDIFLRKLNYKFITDFEYFLRNRKPTDHQKPMDNNGVMKHIERLRKVVKLAKKLEWTNKNPFENYQIKFKKVDRDYLEPDELQKLENTEFKLSRLEFTKDLFVFSCFTGFAYIDIMLLTPDDIHLGIDGNLWIITSRKKTNTPLRIPILPKAREIIEKYRNHPRSLHNGTLFPTISNQKLNSYLKEIADFCGISKNLTFHMARHTFATTVTLSNGVPIETVSKMLGHTSLKTTQIYARIVDTKISEDMSTLRSKLETKELNQKRHAT